MVATLKAKMSKLYQTSQVYQMLKKLNTSVNKA